MFTNSITEIVVPVMEDLDFAHLVAEDVVYAGFDMTAGHVKLCIHEIQSPSLLWLRFDPHLHLPSAERDTIELALAINQSWWLIKIGRDPAEGKVTFDVEIPLQHGQLDKPAFTEYLIRSLTKVDEFLVLLAKVRWGGLNPQEAIGGETPDDQPTRQQRRRRVPEAERQAEEIIRRLTEADSA